MSSGRACLLALCAMAAACFDVPDEFRCADDQQCGPAALCEPTHFCSAPSADCPGTARRYLDSAGPFAGRCVEVPDAGAPLDAAPDFTAPDFTAPLDAADDH